jgi:hypothetical protein
MFQYQILLLQTARRSLNHTFLVLQAQILLAIAALFFYCCYILGANDPIIFYLYICTVASEISQNVLQNFYFAFCEIFQLLSQNFVKFREMESMKISRN